MKKHLFILFCIFIYGASYSQSEYSETELNKMLKTYSFYLGQLKTINEIEKNHTSYKQEAKIAQDLWNVKFRSSIENITSELNRILGEKFKKFKIDVFTELSLVDFSEVSNEDVKHSIHTIKQRAKGDMPSPFIETLLSFTPAYQESPEKEMRDGFTDEYYTSESTKSQGLNIKIKYPKSWKAEDGDRPHVVQKFTHFRGSEFGTALILITKLDESLSKNDITYLLSEEGLRYQIPKNSKVLSTNNNLTIDNIPAGKIAIYHEQQQMQFKLGMISDIYFMYYLDYQITFMCSVGSTIENYNITNNRYLNNKDLFRRMTNNLVILSQYE